MSEKPSYPPYATKDLSELNMNVPSWAVVGPSGQSWKSPGSINFLEAGQHVQKVEDFLGMYSKLSKPNDLPSKSRGKLSRIYLVHRRRRGEVPSITSIHGVEEIR